MKLADNPFTRALRARRKQLGLRAGLGSHHVAEAIAAAGR